MLINESIKNGSTRTQIPAPFGLAGFNDLSLSSRHCQAVAGGRGNTADSIDSAFLWPDMRRMTLTPNKQQFTVLVTTQQQQPARQIGLSAAEDV